MRRLAPLLLLSLALGCGPTGPDPAADAATSLLQPCRIEGHSEEVLCGTVTVPEDPAQPAGRMLDLRVVVFEALAPDAAPDPVFFLAGGPGQAATEIAATALGILKRVRRRRDLVFVDQRGTGSSAPLDCDPSEADESLAAMLSSELDPADLARCRDEWEADPTRYTTPYAMDDLDAVRAALGYQQINLFGGSYGTRAGLVYLRRHEERVRSAVLDGLAPTSMELFLHFGDDAQAALQAAFDDCAAEPGCAAAFPDPAGDLELLQARFAEPTPVSLSHPLTGETEEVLVRWPDLAGLIRGVLYTPELVSLLPFALHRAVAGDLAPLVAQSLAGSGGLADVFSLGMMLSVTCVEDLPRVDEAAILAHSDHFLGDALVREMKNACADWPAGALPAGYHDPVRSDVPVLLLSGALDPVTPPRWGEAVAPHLSQARHLVAAGAGHGVAGRGCGPRLLAQFFDDPAAELEAGCLEESRRPPFMIDAVGWAP